MADHVRLRCDAEGVGCGKVFTAAAVEERLPAGGHEAYFTCPRCGHRYLMFRITPKGLVIRDRLKITIDPAERRELEAQLKEEVTRP